jgi:uncharacterized coiled-coil DUF342 family protein
MTESNESESNLADEIKSLGKNLNDLMKAAWASQERQNLQNDLEKSLLELGETIKNTANEFSQGETGQRLKSDLHEIHKKFESGELQSQARSELLNALKKANEELQKATGHWTTNNAPETENKDDPGNKPTG